MEKKKFYVVWKGRTTGIFDNWGDCHKAIHGFPGAEYKGFENLAQAEKAYEENYQKHTNKTSKPRELSAEEKKSAGIPVWESISVDAAWNTDTKMMEYKGVETKTGKIIFHRGPFHDGTNNVGEFLAIVHALAFCKQRGIQIPIYSDSRTAISWIKNKKAKTELKQSEKNKNLFEMIARAEKWLHENSYRNKILKWETVAWGENPADFGRK